MPVSWPKTLLAAHSRQMNSLWMPSSDCYWYGQAKPSRNPAKDRAPALSDSDRAAFLVFAFGAKGKDARQRRRRDPPRMER